MIRVLSKQMMPRTLSLPGQRRCEAAWVGLAGYDAVQQNFDDNDVDSTMSHSSSPCACQVSVAAELPWLDWLGMLHVTQTSIRLLSTQC